ncbi:MAG: Spy/CpxP family protein refolding chaperone [Polaromonas sp.]|nr:Spy/CpxP family protein refolding chaperone [Polaromonas sp.]
MTAHLAPLFTSKSSSSLLARRTISGLALTSLLLGIGVSSTAQTLPSPSVGMRAPEAMRDAPPANSRMDGPGHRDPARMQAMVAKHQAELKAKLNLTPAQEPAWATFTAAMKPTAGMGVGQHHSPEQRAEMNKLSTPERIDKMRAMRTQRMSEKNALADQHGEATKTFYAQLTPAQKATFDAEHTKRGMHHGGHHGGMKKG